MTRIACLPLSRNFSHMRQYAHYGFFTFVVMILFSSTHETVSLLQGVRHQVLLCLLQYIIHKSATSIKGKHTHNTLLIPSLPYCFQGICCLKKPVLGTGSALSCSTENPPTRVHTIICKNDRFGLSWPLTKLDRMQRPK